jgi:hypothetical protein
VLDTAPAVYFRALCGLVPDKQGYVHCPLPGHLDEEPSCKLYDTAADGWYCYGCRRGGTVITLAAYLAGVPVPVRGPVFTGLLDYLTWRLV